MSEKNNTEASEDQNTLAINGKKGDDPEVLKAAALTDPVTNSGRIIFAAEDGALNVNALAKVLHRQKEKILASDTGRLEELLISQAHALDSMFSLYSRKGMCADRLDVMKGFMNVSLRAQNQCRMTLEALAEIKNPKPYIQNNKAQYQQVNNGGSEPRVQEKPKSANELLEDKTDEHKWMDTGTSKEAVRIDKEMEAMGEKHRTEDQRG